MMKSRFVDMSKIHVENICHLHRHVNITCRCFSISSTCRIPDRRILGVEHDNTARAVKTELPEEMDTALELTKTA